jgi:integrase
MARMTVRAIEGAKPKSVPYKLSVDTGLQIRIATDGAKTWLVRYMIGGKEKQYRLPRPYRDTGGDGFASLADALEEAARIRALARQGTDYQIQLDETNKANAQRRERERAESKTVSDLFEAWLPETDRKDKGAELRRLFGRDVLPSIGTKPVKDVTEDDIRLIAKTVVDRGSNRMAVMLLADMKQMFRWAGKQKAWRKLIEDNPAEPIKASRITDDDYSDEERTRSLSADEIRELRQKLPFARLRKRTEIACWIMLSCCCRIGELVKAKWSDVDLETRIWTIPKENAKNNSEHIVYLSDFALSYFKQLREISEGDWCYPNHAGKSHVCEKSTTKQLRDRQMSALNRKPMTHRSAKADALILSEGGWIPHDLRRTGATIMQSLHIAPAVIERVLNHTEPNKLKRTYQTYEYTDEKREAWRLLGERLELLTRDDAENVIPINRAA